MIDFDWLFEDRFFCFFGIRAFLSKEKVADRRELEDAIRWLRIFGDSLVPMLE